MLENLKYPKGPIADEADGVPVEYHDNVRVFIPRANRDGVDETPEEADARFNEEFRKFLDSLEEERIQASKWEPRMVLVTLIVLTLGWAFLVGLIASRLI